MKINKLIISCMILLISLVSFAYATDHVVISELGIDPHYEDDSTDSGKEYIELYNPTESAIDISNYYLTFKGKASSWNVVIPQSTTIQNNSYYLIGDTGGNGWPAAWNTPDLSDNLGLTNSDFGVKLLDTSSNVIDVVGWGNLGFYPDYYESAPLVNPTIKGYYERKPGYVMPDCGNWQDTDHNANDFISSSIANPQNSASAETPCSDDTTPPASVTNLHFVHKTNESLTWNWTNPVDLDLYQTILYINSYNVANLSNMMNGVYVYNLEPNTEYTITIHTEDFSGNINDNDVSDTQTTDANIVGCIEDIECDNGLDCDGAETCVLNVCQAGTPIDCDDGVGCTDDSCNEDTDSCDNIANDANCDNGVGCDGQETCDLVNDCQAGTPMDCSGNNRDEIAECYYNPDGVEYTFDYRAIFVSECVEPGICTSVDDDNITHTCNTVDCIAECENDNDCDQGYICNLDSCDCVLSGEFFCGDGIRNLDEECDTDDFGGLTCGNYGFQNGNLICNQCIIEFNGCFNFDNDGDGVDDLIDNCPLVANPEQENFDNDSLGDLCDSDDDGDSVSDSADYCQFDPNNDADEDEFCANEDNCPLDYNEDQKDVDNDGQGDVCDNDADNDGINDSEDSCPLDADNDADNDSICGNEDYIWGNSNSINNNLDCIEFSVDNQVDVTNFNGIGNVVLGDCNNNIVEFEFDFGENTLDLTNIVITLSDSKIIIQGIDLTNQDSTKTVYLNITLETDKICIKDQEVASFSVEGDCSNGDIKLTCDETSGQYSCEKIENNTIYKISGLKHSAIVEYSYTAPVGGGNTGGGGGGGSGRTPRIEVTSECASVWRCTYWSECSDSKEQTRVCNDINNCNIPTSDKPDEKRSCGSEEEDTQETIGHEETITEEETEEPTQGIFSITGAVIGNIVKNPIGIVSLIIVLLIIICAIGLVYITIKEKKGKK